jgi:hypothetical protein
MGQGYLGEQCGLWASCLVVRNSNIFPENLIEVTFLSFQAASSEVMALRASRMYDPASKSIVLANGIPLTIENMEATGQPKEYTELVFKLCHDMAELSSDNAEYALFMAISIFSGKR